MLSLVRLLTRAYCARMKITSNSDIPEDENAAPEKGERIAKVLARAGVGSRRDVERMIGENRIRIDGKILDTPATLVTTLDGITVDGEPVMQPDEAKLWRFHKSRGLLTTHKDPEGRPTVFDKLPDHLGRVISVGRLDMNTEGLLLLTNDGNLARWMELPKTALVRRYRVRVYGRVDDRTLARLKDGVTIDGIHYGEVDARLERVKAKKNKDKSEKNESNQNPSSSANTWLTVAITEGKNREVRRLMEYLGLTVNRLIRTHYGPFSMGTMPQGAVAAVSGKQLRDLLPDYFDEAPDSVARPAIKRDPTKWARAKKPTKNKPGASRRRKPSLDHDTAPDSKRAGNKPARDGQSSRPSNRQSNRQLSQPSKRESDSAADRSSAHASGTENRSKTRSFANKNEQKGKQTRQNGHQTAQNANKRGGKNGPARSGRGAAGAPRGRGK